MVMNSLMVMCTVGFSSFHYSFHLHAIVIRYVYINHLVHLYIISPPDHSDGLMLRDVVSHVKIISS